MIKDKHSQTRPLKDKNAQKDLWFLKLWRKIFRLFWFSILTLISQATFAVTVPAGDLAPYGTRDNQVNVADVLILQRFVLGNLVPTAEELLIGDVVPDGQLNAADILLLQRAVLGEVSLPPVLFPPTSPVLDTTASQVNNYQINLAGTAIPNIQVDLYQEGIWQITTTVAVDDSFSFTATLVEGVNSFYVTAFEDLESDPSNILNITLDVTSPTPVDTANITISTVVGGIVTVSGTVGSVEGNSIAILTNPRTGESVTIMASADGSLIANIAAREGDDITIAITDTAGNTSATRYTQVPGTAPPLAITIDYPADGQSTTESYIPVYGTFIAPDNTGITVNGKIASLKDGKFYINNLSLTPGSNTINVTAILPDGVTVTQTITITSTADTLMLVDASPNTGIAPLTVSFEITNNTGNTITSITVDADNDGTPDLTATDLSTPLEYTYNVPGIYTATITINDNLGNTYTSTQFIIVQGIEEKSNQIQAVYTGMLEQLRVGNVTGALNSISVSARTKFEGLFNLLLPKLTLDNVNLGQIKGVVKGNGWATITVIDYRLDGKYGYYITLVQGNDGIWRIEDM